MAKRKGRAKGLTLKEKLHAWFEENRGVTPKDPLRHPTNGNQLAQALGCKSGAVYPWVVGSSLPGVKLGRPLAELMGASLSYLRDPTTPWPPRALPGVDAIREKFPHLTDRQLDLVAVVLCKPSLLRELERIADEEERSRKGD